MVPSFRRVEDMGLAAARAARFLCRTPWKRQPETWTMPCPASRTRKGRHGVPRRPLHGVLYGSGWSSSRGV
ncbi:MAG TPA: hypothetical protein DEF41_01345 [Desulfovibrio sp.]|uniref:Uncharacterized protein n=1 Tax=Nitratidesulfovibrio vulgaris (strain ATCC 29579 / DSM 644 / CCUG 34227 / NCIMB 8303 / VKM B-1760 / Hildenborough) TaxID=882 RepID=Q72DV5_NITV2|nr:hypothetical protein DVU_0824 [Nitratidesulfovibrio vulgaris str. Hildenborough]HBW14803.1 hypothetical protein [Desulfovibrio sp.]